MDEGKGSGVGRGIEQSVDKVSIGQQWRDLIESLETWSKEAEYKVAKLYLDKTLEIVRAIHGHRDATSGAVHHVFIDVVVVLEVLTIQHTLLTMPARDL